MEKLVAAFLVFITCVPVSKALASQPFYLAFGAGAFFGSQSLKRETESGTININANQYNNFVCSYKGESHDAGFFFFTDCPWAQVSAGLLFQKGQVTEIGSSWSGGSTGNGNTDVNNIALSADFLFKFPLYKDFQVVFYPALGAGFRRIFSGYISGDYASGLTWALDLKCALGLDFMFKDRFFLRCEASYYYEIFGERTGKAALNSSDAANGSSIAYKTPLGFNGVFCMGISLKIALGYKIISDPIFK